MVTILFLFVVSFLGALLLRLEIPAGAMVDGADAILAVAAPHNTIAGDRYAAYGGMSLSVEGSYVFRLCGASGECPIRRTGRTTGETELWGWLANYPTSLQPGEYVGELFVVEPGLFGVERTIGYYRWEQHVE